MVAKLSVLLLLAIASQTDGDCVTAGTELVSTFLVHRHGDRTPATESQLSYSTDPEALEAATNKYGYRQLTNEGKRRAYNLGKYFRTRYDDLLSDQYDSSEIYIRSTNTSRAEMTIFTALTALFPSYPSNWSEQVTIPPAKYDFNLPNVNCPVFIDGYKALLYSDNCRMDEFSDVLNFLADKIGFVMKNPVYTAIIVFEVLVSQTHLGIPLPDDIAAVMPKLEAAAGVARDICTGNKKYLSYQAGPLLNEFFTYADKQIIGTDTPLVRIYSAHDFNVYSFESITQISPRQGVPRYAAVFALELRVVEKTGKYVVLLVYTPSPGEDPIYLPVIGCDRLLCPYDTFKEIVSPYVVDEDTWRTNCGFTSDLVVDDSSI